MATLSLKELLDWLGTNQFLSSVQAEALRPLLISFPDCHAFAKELIRRNWLTPFQVNQILQGRHDQLLLGSYRLTERIGEGAMGQVYKAWSPRLQRVVAVKMIHKEHLNSEKALERFRREVETAAQLDHPNIALVRDADEAGGRTFLVMDFIDGFNLAQRVKQAGPLPIAEAVEYARQTALGLQHALERGIVHRDIKPANLLVTTVKGNGDTQPLVKILDFGLARFESERDNSSRLTQLGNLLGTVDYVAPEQAQDAHKADIRADIYSLGCSLYYMLAGRPPFEGENVVEKLGPRLTGEAPWVRAVRPEVPPGLEEVLRRMMARLPEDRYQTPVEAAQALQPYVLKEAAPLARALPVSGPPLAGVVMAMPVTNGAAVPVPVAQAVAVPAEESPTPAEDAAFLGMTATGRDMSTPASAAGPAPAKNAKSMPTRTILAFTAAAILGVALLGAGICLISFFLGGGPKKNEGSIQITGAKLSVPTNKIIPGSGPKQVLVYIERTGFSGPVRVTFRDLPAGVNPSKDLVIPANSKSGAATFTVSYGTDPLVAQITVHAESELEGITPADFPLTLTVIADPAFKKK